MFKTGPMATSVAVQRAEKKSNFICGFEEGEKVMIV